MPPETTLQQLIALLSAHSWLPVIALATLYLRKILSPASGFPITVPPRWLPVVSSTGALASGLVSSLQAGEGAGAAILDMAIMAASGGFFDGLLTAIFDHDNAPAWARAIVFVFDDLGGGGSGGKRAAGGPAFGHPKSTTPFNPIIAEAAKQPPPPAAARRFLSSKEIRARHLACCVAFLVAACVTMGLASTGCSWLGSPQGVATIKGGVDLAICVLNHEGEPVPQIVTDCGASSAEDVVRILDAHRAAVTREMARKDGGS
jgi:hypothetical protein